jgi:hypothetical protein
MSAADERRKIRHFMRINTCSKTTFERHVVRALDLARAQQEKVENRLGCFSVGDIAEAKAASDLNRRRRAAAAAQRASAASTSVQ